MLIIKAVRKLHIHYCTTIFFIYIPIVSATNISQPAHFKEPDSALTSGLKIALNNSSLPLIEEVTSLYQARKYSAIWNDGEKYNNKAYALQHAIQNARKYGLKPNDYDLEIINYFLESTIDDPIILGKSDITFTHAYIKLSRHIKNDVDNYLSDEYALFVDDTFLTQTPNRSIEIAPTKDLVGSSLIKQDHYLRMLNALDKYRNLNNKFEPILLRKKSLTLGDASPEISKARKRLHELGDYQFTDFSNEIFDETLALAISDFQYRHGLEADGILGKRTVREINTTIEQRALQLEINLQRAKQISEIDADRYILVNVPEYKLYVIENGEKIYESRVVVGKKKFKTPSISSEISEFVVNPYWNIPTSITKNEIIPKLQEDPEYLTKNNMRVISRFNNRNHFIDPEFVDWSSADPEITPFRIRQDPGKRNALGRVKFIFPNNHRVYLHDTPSRNLFARNSRAFSHGCVRVENPFKLAEVLLSNSENWSNEDLQYFANRTKTKVIKLDRPIPIHITYMTAWADEQGVVHFRPDIYKQDSQVANNLYNTER